MAETDKELQLLEKRFAELANRSWQQNIFTFCRAGKPLLAAEYFYIYRIFVSGRAGCASAGCKAGKGKGEP